jgi:hypothetical protein
VPHWALHIYAVANRQAVQVLTHLAALRELGVLVGPESRLHSRTAGQFVTSLTKI